MPRNKPHTEETKRKIGEALKGKKRSPHTEERKNNISKAMRNKTRLSRGENHYNWKGGTTKLGILIRQLFKYRQWRSDVFTRDNFTCQDCFVRGGYLEAHHLKEFSIIVKENNIKTTEDALNCEELWNINNGATLCKKCHNKTKVARYKLCKVM